MEVSEHIDALRRDGELLAHAASALTLDTSIPTCPEWKLRDLLLHVGGVHRWAAAHVAEARTAMIDIAQPIDIVDAPPTDDEVLDWFVDGHAALVSTLETAPADVEAFTFLPAPSPLAFWARRQAHETGIHRADAQSAGLGITPFPAAFAVDGIDELLFGFARRPRREPADHRPRTLTVRATGTAARWRITLQPGAVELTAGEYDNGADLSIDAPASDLYLLLWNRRGLEGLEVTGDEAVLDLWREAVRVRWT